jgi:transposase-like protein
VLILHVLIFFVASTPYVHIMLVSIQTPCTRCTYPIAVKRTIVREAYSTPHNIKPVARKYNVQPHQIREWRKFVDSDTTNTTACDSTSTTVKTRRRVAGGGRKCLLSARLVAELKGFFDSLRDEDFGVSLRIMTTELRRLSPEAVDGCTEGSINSRVYRLLRKWDNTWRRGTHKAQNTRHTTEVIED